MNVTPAGRFRPHYFQTGSGHDRWMISYTDIVTILLILFVALAAQSLQHPAKTAAAAPAASVAPTATPAPLPTVLPQRRSTLLATQEKLREHGLESRLEPRGLVISLPQAILFASGEDRITPDAESVVAKIADVLKDIPNRVSLIGHADSIPIHNSRFKNNWELSAARGLRLLEVLSREYGIPESRLSVASDGSYDPASRNDTAAGRAINRRVEIVILANSGTAEAVSGLEANHT